MHSNGRELRMRGVATLALLAVLIVLPGRGAAVCAGDCDGSGEVTISELILMVNIALERLPVDACRAGDRDGCGDITINELVHAVNVALNGCPEPTATLTPTATETATPSPTPSVPIILYDPTDTRHFVPFPDDVWLVADERTATGVRLAVPEPAAPADVRNLYRALLAETNTLDGFSPIAHFVIELSEAPDPQTLPLTPAASLDPGATVGLFDIAPDSPTFGMRVPFLLRVRDDLNSRRIRSHTLLIFPSIPLEPAGRYGLVITRGVHTESGEPFEPSPFFDAALAEPEEGEPETLTRARALADDVLDAVEQLDPPIARADVALALRVSVRTVDTIPNDMLAIKEQVLAAVPPVWTVTDVTPGSGDVAAIVTGTWDAPDWRTNGFFSRDEQGRPVQTKTNRIAFTLALPKAALDGPVPVTIYQHGNPGSQAEVRNYALSRGQATAGFAVIGFTDILNRELSSPTGSDEQRIAEQVLAIYTELLRNRKVLDAWAQTNAEQLAFLRMIQGLGTLDVLPLGAPDGIPDLDVGAPVTYVGISQGANHAPEFLAYAPEVRAAALVVGGSRLVETLIHQQAEQFLTQLGPLFPSLTATDIWSALVLLQTIFDQQDAHNHARFIYRDPVVVAGTTRKASILVIEGVDDSLVPNNATDSLAWQLGPIPHVNPVQRAVPFLDVVDGPVVANIAGDTTAAFFQYVPEGVPGLPASPGCAVLPPRNANEGHYCAQGAAESVRQRVIFFQTALSDTAPRIQDGLAE